MAYFFQMSNRKQEREKLIKKIAEKRALLESRGDVKVKVPRLSLPENSIVRPENLFSLPPEIMEPFIASGFPGYRKKMAAKKKKGFFVAK